MRIKDMNPKLRKRKIQTWFRAGMQLLFFILFPSMFTAAFNGVKYIFTQIGSGNRIELTSFVAVLLMLCVYTMIFGRFFCGFACAFGSFGDAVHAIYVSCCRKLNKKPVSIPAKAAKKLTYMKYVILTIILILCYLGVYSSLKGTSPWDVFSMLRGRKFRSWFIYHRSSSAWAYNHRYVCAGEAFLPLYVSDGSCFFNTPYSSCLYLAQR